MLNLLSHLRGAVLLSLSFAVVPLPSWLKILIYRRVYGYHIGPNVRIGLSWFAAQRVTIGANVTIRHLNRFKNIPEVHIGDFTTIGHGNTFTSTPEFTLPKAMAERGNRPALIIGRHCGITMFHYFDVQDEFTIGSYTTIAGRQSVFYTHYLDVVKGSQECKPIMIGDYCMLGSCVRFAPGAEVGDCCVVGMGAVVTRRFIEHHSLIAGNPAAVIRSLPEDAAYFRRASGWISSCVAAPYCSRSASDTEGE